MKKILSLTLVLCMIVSLIGCSNKESDVLGVYDAALDVTDMLVEAFDGDIVEYIEKFQIPIVFEFNEDGTFKHYLDEEKYAESIQTLKSSVILYVEDVLAQEFIKNIFAADPDLELELNDKEDLEKYTGMTMESLVKLTVGIDMNESLDEIIEEFKNSDWTKKIIGEGVYKAEDGKLYMSSSLNEEIDKESYWSYTVKDNVVTIIVNVNVEEDMFFDYPIELIKREIK